MKIDMLAPVLSPDPAKVCISRSHSKITNISALWWPGVSIPSRVHGVTSANISLESEQGCMLKAGLMRSRHGLVSLWLTYISPSRRVIARPEFLSDFECIYFEIDTHPTTSQVTFWINDKGLDMGVLPGFEYGAQRYAIEAHATQDAHLFSGKFTDCAFASTSGWIACDLSKSQVGHSNLQDHHTVDILSLSSIAIGDKRSA